MTIKWRFLAMGLVAAWAGSAAQALEPTVGRVGGMALPPVVTMAERNPVETRFEQVWEVVELMGRPVLLDPQQRPLRILFRTQGDVRVDGGCNRFVGRLERDAQGLFRVSKYTGTHGGCEVPPRSEAVLNSALVMADNFRWDQGLVLRGGDNELVRLVPSPNQDTQGLEPPPRRPILTEMPALAAAPMAAAAMVPALAAAPMVTKPHCEPAPVPPKKGKAKTPAKAKAKGKTKAAPMCTPVQLAQWQRWEKAQALMAKAQKAAKGKKGHAGKAALLAKHPQKKKGKPGLGKKANRSAKKPPR